MGRISFADEKKPKEPNKPEDEASEMTPEDYKKLYGIDIIMPEPTEIENSDVEGDYDEFTIIYDFLCKGGGYPWGWEEFFWVIPWWRILEFYEINRKRYESASAGEFSREPMNWNGHELLQTISTVLSALTKNSSSNTLTPLDPD